jgi:hypothetical protein
MSQAVILRQYLASVEQLRLEERSPPVQYAWQAVRRVQVQRFRATYADFLSDGRHSAAAQFFLSELYGQHDYTQRDAQFGRIAGAIERLFPHHVMTLAVQIAQVHALTETMDWAMAAVWAESPHVQMVLAAQTQSRPIPADALAAGYIHAWRTVQRYDDRQRQLQAVLALGEQLTRVVRIAGLRTALKLMRRPAHAAGLSALQAVLEQGFDAFAAMGNTSAFLKGITDRETHWLDTLHHDTPFTTATQRLEVALRAVVPTMD